MKITNLPIISLEDIISRLTLNDNTHVTERPFWAKTTVIRLDCDIDEGVDNDIDFVQDFV